MLVQTENMLADFKITRESSNVDEIYDALKRLRPNKLNTKKLLELISYIESFAAPCLKNSSYYPLVKSKHYNIFGTGGDDYKTINLSTIASIFASRFIPVLKVGTNAVTAKWGSAQFFLFIQKLERLKASSLTNVIRKIHYCKGSGFIPLKDLGFDYLPPLKQARVQLHQDGILDIYKVIFPISNFTNSHGQVNGVYSLAYLGYYIDICRQRANNSLIVYSYRNIDELIAGKNLAVRIVNGSVLLREVEVPQTLDQAAQQAYNEFIAESPEKLSHHVRKLIKLVDGDCLNDVIWTLAYNVAALLSLDREWLAARGLPFHEIHLEPLAAETYNAIKHWEQTK